VRTTARWIRADLGSHRLQSVLVVLATAGTVAALLLAGALLGTADPWQRQFHQAQAPHVRIDTTAVGRADGDTALASLARLPGVDALTPQQDTADTTLIGLRGHGSTAPADTGGDRLPLVLRADVHGAPRALITEGRWLDPTVLNGLVLEHSSADAVWAHPGDHVAALGNHGQLIDLQVVGIADSPDQIRYPEADAGLGWVLPEALDLVQPDPAARGRTVGLYLADPSTADYTAQRAVSTIGAGRVTKLATWMQARTSRQQDDRMAGLLLALSGLAALLAATLAVAGAASGRIRVRTGDIALLKALGFSPSQVVRMFTGQHLLLAGTGVLLGGGAATGATWLWPALAGGPAAPGRVLPFGLPVTGAVTATALAAIGLGAALPAYRAARVSPVPPGEGVRVDDASPRPARLHSLRRLPPALVLGLGGALRHPRQSAVTVLRLAVPVAACTLALSTWTTLDAMAQTSAGGVMASTLTVRPTIDNSGQQSEGLRAALAADPAVAGVFPGAEMGALAPGQSATLTLRALGTTSRPFPFAVVEGRGIRADDEAVAGQGALDLLNAKVGQWVRVTTGSTPRILHIVGRNIEPERGGRILSTALDSLGRPGAPQQPDFYHLVLRPGSVPKAVQLELLGRTGLGGQLDIRPTASPTAGTAPLRGSVVGLIVLLALIALAELLTATADGLREYQHDLGLLRAIGVTPRQIAAMMATRGAALASGAMVLGAGVGIPLGRWLIDMQGTASGIGEGIARTPAIGALIALVALTFTTASALPALAVTRLRGWQTVHRE
jgi:putative ABC transport system permease protein